MATSLHGALTGVYGIPAPIYQPNYLDPNYFLNQFTHGYNDTLQPFQDFATGIKNLFGGLGYASAGLGVGAGVAVVASYAIATYAFYKIFIDVSKK